MSYEGGSTSTLHALIAAREQRDNLHVKQKGLAGRPEIGQLRIYTSEYGHSSIDKAAIAMGLGLDSVRQSR